MKITGRALMRIAAAAVAMILLGVTVSMASGHFEGRLILQAMDDGTLQTVEKFTYIDAQSVRWEVPIRTTTDGASVPRVLWGLLPPLQGRYLKAAVVHDYNCATRKQPWRRVHKVFYEAMLDAQVEKKTAKVMYAAVYAFGPRWTDDGTMLAAEIPRPVQEQEIAFEGLKLWIEENDPDLAEIDQRVTGDHLQ